IMEVRTFDMLVYHPGSETYLPMSELTGEGVFRTLADGSEELDGSGMPLLKDELSTALYSNFDADSEGFININNLGSYRVARRGENGVSEPVEAFRLLVGRWLPMPMFECSDSGSTIDSPEGWCRMKIERIGEGVKKGEERFRLIWAFDTTLSEDPLDTMQPYFYEEEESEKRFRLCNYPYAMLKFLSTDADGYSGFSDYLASLLEIDPVKDGYKYLAYYIYLVNFIRLKGGSPEVTLHNPPEDKDIPVDMVLDIGNSRTCGVLFEDGDFTRAEMLELRDLTHPERVYNEPFDMRLAFRKPDLGNDIPGMPDMFNWKSFVRLGREAADLIYSTIDAEGLSRRTTNYSSPKRYLWDEAAFDGVWEFLTTDEDPSNVRLSGNVYIPGLSELFNSRGEYLGYVPAVEREFDDAPAAFSRSSLMTFVMLEIFMQALSQINSPRFRNRHGDIDLRRVLRNVIITCPTAMPVSEQIRLRRTAADAAHALHKELNSPRIEVIPSVESLTAGDSFDVSKRSWSYDEASCCQLVYLYAELAQRYEGEIEKFFELKGHRRPEFAEQGYDRPSLTIGTIDIGAGTTDIMICSYQYEGKEKPVLRPVPLFWDSFYQAGDDILRAIVQNQVIEGKYLELPGSGNITSALTARLLQMEVSEIEKIPGVAGSEVLSSKARDLHRISDPEENRNARRRLAANIVHAFFGEDSALMSFSDRRTRVDFNTQISLPLAQFFMEELRRGNPAKSFSFEEIFGRVRPSAKLLDRFAGHFGFRFEELGWRFEPEETAEIVKGVMEPLMRQLAMVVYAYDCDILVLAGRPTSLNAITDLFIKYLPLTPDRLVRLNNYRVGKWFPFADGQGYFHDQKAVVAVGAMVGHIASHEGFNGMWLDFTEMKKKMHSTARYMGIYRSGQNSVGESLLSPVKSSVTLELHTFPTFIGCRQFDSEKYQARPVYGIFNHTSKNMLRITLSRSYHEDRETLTLEEVTDEDRNPIARKNVELKRMSLADDGKYWLDKGEFNLSVIGK
ncbi:MAG: virulence factor SrfB, partial [Muribaculaceae bacterium]|nr:virulence factor SrfB [Muribaculaceae bacterium]